VILAVAAALRAVGIEYGLPFGSLLNPDEQSIVPRAWLMTHGGGADPNWFDYPSLVLYALAPFQAWQGGPSYLTARIVMLLFGLAAVALTWWLGRRAYGTVAAAVAAAVVAVDATHVAYSRMAVTDAALTALVALSLGLLVTDRLELAGLAAGLAAGAKYPGVFLIAPLLVVGWRRWRRLAVAGGLAVAAFLATSPFILAHPGRAWDDASRVQRLAREGWLGFENDHFALVAFVERLWHGMGPALIVAGVGLVLALLRRTRADLVLCSFCVVYFADLLTLSTHFDRYVLPLVPALAVLAGSMRSLAPVTLILLVVPLTWSAQEAARLTRTDTRVVAERWIRAHVPDDALIAAEPSTVPLAGYRRVPLELPGPGRPFDENRDVPRLRSRGVGYVLVSGAVADRVLAARSRYPREARFYDDLQRTRRVYYRQSGGRLTGPWVALYRL
jgi:4-amino-4-deoxy-L-arabinose transferase-like glycosyltransferase